MADIILAGDSFSLKKLRSAAEQLEDAQNLMQKVYDAVFSTSFWAEANPFALLDGSKNMNVFDGTIDELHTYQQRVHQKEETLRTLAQRMETAVQEIAETDQSFRGKLNGESSVKRAWNSFWDSIATASKIASTPAIPILAAIGRLFHSEGTVAGETPIEVPTQKKIRFTDDEIETIYGEFDWRGISVTDEEKTAIVQRASDKWELHLLFEKLYNEKLDAIPPMEVRDFREGVQRGNIRYIDQNGGYEPNRKENGWGTETYQAGGECGTACESMCMSYLGIDATPERILTSRGGFNWGSSDNVDGLYGEPVAQTSTPNCGWDYDDIGQKIDNYMNDKGRGNVSPVLIRYSASHVVMILDKTINPDGSWTCRVLGPSNYGRVKEHDIVTVTISKDGYIRGNLANIEGGTSKIIQCVQYYRTD